MDGQPLIAIKEPHTQGHTFWPKYHRLLSRDRGRMSCMGRVPYMDVGPKQRAERLRCIRFFTTDTRWGGEREGRLSHSECSKAVFLKQETIGIIFLHRIVLHQMPAVFLRYSDNQKIPLTTLPNTSRGGPAFSPSVLPTYSLVPICSNARVDSSSLLI